VARDAHAIGWEGFAVDAVGVMAGRVGEHGGIDTVRGTRPLTLYGPSTSTPFAKQIEQPISAQSPVNREPHLKTSNENSVCQVIA
jgi:hypothetical protein